MLKSREEEVANLQSEIELMQQKEKEILNLHETQLKKLEELCNGHTSQIEHVTYMLVR